MKIQVWAATYLAQQWIQRIIAVPWQRFKYFLNFWQQHIYIKNIRGGGGNIVAFQLWRCSYERATVVSKTDINLMQYIQFCLKKNHFK
jgi:hypothetical protein